MPKPFNEFKEQIETYAKKIGCIINPMFKLEKFQKVLTSFGDYYCPCRPVDLLSDAEKKDIICPCKTHLSDIKKQGRCYCNMFVIPKPKSLKT